METRVQGEPKRGRLCLQHVLASRCFLVGREMLPLAPVNRLLSPKCTVNIALLCHVILPSYCSILHFKVFWVVSPHGSPWDTPQEPGVKGGPSDALRMGGSKNEPAGLSRCVQSRAESRLPDLRAKSVQRDTAPPNTWWAGSHRAS